MIVQGYMQWCNPQISLTKRRIDMSWDTVEGNWKQIKGKVRETWGELTDDEIEQIAGKRDMLLGKIQEKYGIGVDEANKRISEFEKENF